LRGAQHHFKVNADLVTWGKGIANGFSCCALTGRADIMELGGIRKTGEEKLFLISTTHGAETTGLAAMLATIEAFRAENMIPSNWQRGQALAQRLQDVIASHGLADYIRPAGDPCLLAVSFSNARRQSDDSYRTLFMQEMIAAGVLFQGLFYTTWSHQAAELDRIVSAFDHACAIYAKALEAGTCEGLLVGPPVKAVFRRRI
jgi:glutamate-1-semialdehyde 2,1-aminomutase